MSQKPKIYIVYDASGEYIDEHGFCCNARSNCYSANEAGPEIVISYDFDTFSKTLVQETIENVANFIYKKKHEKS